MQNGFDYSVGGRTDVQIGAAKKAQTMRLGQSGAAGMRKRCRKGKSCGASCINSSKFCLVDIPWAGPDLSRAAASIQNRKPAKREKPAPPKKVDNRSISEKLAEALPKFEVTKSNSYLNLSQMVDGHRLLISFTPDRSIIFTVDGSIMAPNVPDKTGVKISLQVRNAAKELFKIMPDGTTFEVSAATSDGKGEKRVKAYERIGFSTPTYTGGEQAGVVRGGKLYPIDPSKYWEDKTRLEFKEKSEAGEVADWFEALFGRKPNLKVASLANLD